MTTKAEHNGRTTKRQPKSLNEVQSPAAPSELEQLQQAYNVLYESYVEACRALGEATVNQRFLSSKLNQVTQEQASHQSMHLASVNGDEPED